MRTMLPETTDRYRDFSDAVAAMNHTFVRFTNGDSTVQRCLDVLDGFSNPGVSLLPSRIAKWLTHLP